MSIIHVTMTWMHTKFAMFVHKGVVSLVRCDHDANVPMLHSTPCFDGAPAELMAASESLTVHEVSHVEAHVTNSWRQQSRLQWTRYHISQHTSQAHGGGKVVLLHLAAHVTNLPQRLWKR
jgi:hypothetical protein